MKFVNPYWSITTKLELLEQWVLVHSLLYYEFDEAIVPDHMFDNNAHQLAKALKKYPKEAAASRYGYCFKDFDGSTGHHLIGLLSEKDKAHILSRGLTLLNMSQTKRKR